MKDEPSIHPPRRSKKTEEKRFFSLKKKSRCTLDKIKLRCTLDKIVLFKENLPKSTLTTRIVLQVELIKAMKCALVRVNI
jgi:hypothetical protein